MLYEVPGPTIGLFEAMLDGSAATPYMAMPRVADAIAWAAESQTVFAAIESAGCYGPVACQEYHYDVVRITATDTTSLGTVNGTGFAQFSVSPDGNWLAHRTLGGKLYLLHR